MRKTLSIILAIILVFGSISSGFAASGSGSFNANEFVKVKATGSVPDSSAGIAFDVEGEYTSNGINYDFYLTLAPGVDELEVTIIGYPAELGATSASVDYELGDDPYTGDIQQEHSFMIDLTDEECEDGTIEIDIKWFPPSGSSQEVMHGSLHITCTPENFDLDVSIEGQGATNPTEGTHSYEEGRQVDLEADPASGWHFVEWQGPVASSGSADTTVLIEGYTEVTAVFERNEYDLLVDHMGEGSTSPSGTSTPEFEEVINLEAIPATGWHFVEWQGPVDDSLDPTTTVEILENTHVTAIFEINQYDLIVDHTGQGTTSPDGTSSHNFEEMVNLEAIPATGWHFVEWQGPVEDANDPTTMVEILEMTEVTAVFEINRYELDVSHTGSGSTVPDGTGVYLFEDLVQLTATPSPGWFFVGWTGPDAADVAGNEIMIDNDKVIVAQFEEIIPDMVRLTITVDGNGTTVPTPGSHQYTSGASVILEAIPDMGWEFVEWLGPVASNGSSETTILMDEDKEVEAVFEMIDYTLTVTHMGQGTTTPSGASTVNYGDEIGLTAVPDQGWTFSHWTGPVASPASASTLVAIEGNTEVEAVFVEIPPNMVSLTVTHIGQGSTNPSGTDMVTEGTVVDLLAIPASGWHFVEWLGPVDSVNTATSSITVLESTTATAVFEPDQVELYTLYMAVDGNGTTNPSPGSHSYEPGEIVNLDAIAGSGWYLVDWVGTHGSVVSNGTIEMNGDRWITALFKEEEVEMVTLTVNIQGSGITDPNEGDHQYPIEEEALVVDLFTSADPGWYFDGWIGDVDNEQVVMDEDKEITAVFKEYSTPPPPILRNRLKISIEGNGTVGPFVGSQNYLPGTIVDVTADPGSGWVFDGWIGPDGADVSSGQIQMDDDKTIIAKFVQAPAPPPIEPPEIIIPLTETPLADGDLPNTGEATQWLTLILGFSMVTFGYLFKKETE
jgi:LPXTG-motif cell wall-anchored protein